MRDLVEVIARWIGWKPPPSPIASGDTTRATTNEAAFGDLLRQFPGGQIRG